ncbi:MAG: OFA family MFS transporter [Myxococcales bacterium]|nr:OFA family MFS transporter [Myxococcales bacterium]
MESASPAAPAKVMNRWIVVIGAIVVQLCLGAIYAWSAFTGKLTAADGPFHFTKTETQIIFSVGLLSFAVIMALIAGKWQAKVGPRIVAITGGIVMGLGYVLAALLNNFWGILIGVGFLGGAGIGLAYVCPIATCVKWFPDKKGLITGLAVAGFGFGALIWVKLTEGFKFGPINLSPGWTGLWGSGWSVADVFLLYGVLFAALVLVASLVLVNPPAGFKPAGWNPPVPGSTTASGGVDFSASEMVRTPQFWSLFVTFMFGATSGLMVIGIIKLFGMDALKQGGVTTDQASIITGTAMGLFYALFNGLGRIIWGWISDRTGRKAAIVAMSALQGVMMIAFYFIGGSEVGLYIGATIIGFNFGGNFALFPAATADFFGNKNVGTNYPWVFMSYGVGGVVGPILGGLMGDANAWLWAFLPAGIACLLGAAIMLAVKPPQRKAAAPAQAQ